MNRPVKPGPINVFEAVKYDIRLHGFRFIFLEFFLVGLGALILVAVELLHAGHGGPPLLGAIWFLSVALNCFAVALLAIQVRRTDTSTQLSDRKLHLYTIELVVMLLIPLAVPLAALLQWHAGDFRAASDVPTVKEIS